MNQIIQQLLASPDEVYNHPLYKRNAAFRKKVKHAESLLLESLLQVSMTNNLAQWEYLHQSRDALDEMQSDIISTDDSSKNIALPDSLSTYIHQSFQYDEMLERKQDLKNTFAIRFIQEGLQVVTKTAQSMQLRPMAAQAIRLQDTKAQENHSLLIYSSSQGPVNLHLMNEGRDLLEIHCQLPQSQSGQVVLKEIPQMNLKQARTIETLTLQNESEFTLHSIEAGAYLIQIPSMELELSFLLHAPVLHS